LTTNPIAIKGVQKQHVKRLVRNQCPTASVIISNNGNSSSVSWPSCETGGAGERPKSSSFAAGLTSIIDLDEKTLAKELGDIIGAMPSKDDLATYLKAKNVTINVDALWTKIQGLGWDGQHKHAKEIGTRLKGQWEQVTGERFGVSKIKTWRPKGWGPDLDKALVEDLEMNVDAMRRFLEEAIGQGAVDHGKVEADRKAAEKISDLAVKIKEEKNKLYGIDHAILDIQKTIKELPPAAMKCPHCNKMVMPTDTGKYLSLVTATDEAISPEKRATDLEDCNKGLREANQSKHTVSQTINNLTKDWSLANDAKKNASPISKTLLPSTSRNPETSWRQRKADSDFLV